MFKSRKKNFFEKKMNILLVFIVLILITLFFFLEWFVPIPKTKVEKIIESKSFIIKNLNNFITYNLNHNTLIKAINNKIYNG